jgi:fumarate hydratase class I
MPAFAFQETFPRTAPDTTPYRRLDLTGVGTDTFRGQSILTVEPSVLRALAAEAVRDVSHLFRPGHLGP